MGLLLDRLLECGRLESVLVVPFATVTVADARLQCCAREMERKRLLSECAHNILSVALMRGEVSQKHLNPDLVRVRSVPASRPFDDDVRRKHEDLPASAQLGLHKAFLKFSASIHLMFALNLRGNIDRFGRKRPVYRGANKKRRRQGPGHLAANGNVLEIN